MAAEDTGMLPAERDRLVKLEQQMIDMREDMGEIKGDVKAILATLAEARGGWKTLILIAGASGAFGALALKTATVFGVFK